MYNLSIYNLCTTNGQLMYNLRMYNSCMYKLFAAYV